MEKETVHKVEFTAALLSFGTDEIPNETFSQIGWNGNNWHLVASCLIVEGVRQLKVWLTSSIECVNEMLLSFAPYRLQETLPVFTDLV